VAIVFDLLLVLSIVVWLLPLVERGAITSQQAALAMAGLVVLVAVARALGIGVARLVLRLALPIASLAVFIAWYGEGAPRLIGQLLEPILMLLIVLAGLYVIVRGAFGRNRRG